MPWLYHLFAQYGHKGVAAECRTAGMLWREKECEIHPAMGPVHGFAIKLLLIRHWTEVHRPSQCLFLTF